MIDGKKISNEILADLKIKIENYKKLNNKTIKLAIILVGSNSASRIYVHNKIKAAARVGILTDLQEFEDNISQNDLLKEISILNKDPNVSGMIVQLPLPRHIDKSKILNAIDPKKDVDGFHPINVGLLYSPYENGFVPCTARGCLTLIKSQISDLSGKNVVIIGRSNIVGRPIAALLLKEDCTVTICHSKTENLESFTYKADIVISAVGVPKFLTKNYFNQNALVIDVGINRIENSVATSQLVGDVDFEEVKKVVKYITPVPGGVGPMTVAYLLVNTYMASVENIK
ncbi:MAG: bifunctional 5,10-methylenetetrahydrofolate dehydrogenase/5,10-methenyltetrahydrofolate cyclohydrolase [Rickettsiales bacterium]|nr:MAG: bifunctional 5,10-methylenetetrahydrofolate dehydrogenase/5,10-methenyltetrahydrofolate cyclohydrolase [Rickettsiales bacterium]